MCSRMSVTYVLLIILVSVNGRLIEPVEKLVDISENAIESENIELKNTINNTASELTAANLASTPSVEDQKIYGNYASSVKHDSIDSVLESVILCGNNGDKNESKPKAYESDNLISTLLYKEKTLQKNTTIESIKDESLYTPHEENKTACNVQNSTLLLTTESNPISQETNAREIKPDLNHITNNTLRIDHIYVIHSELNPIHQYGIDDYETNIKLTPYIKNGLLEQARNASEVNSSMFLDYQSYSGYLTVDHRYDSNTFFWYFPVVGKPVEEAPWIIWLQGGPGSSTMHGLFHEIGPFTVDHRGVLNKNPYSWLQNHSLVFIDNPVGAGFSYTNHEDGYARSMEAYSAHLYEATRQLLLLFPELQRAPLYVAGESYAGKYVPSLALELHNHKDEIGVNLQGIMLSNAVTGPRLSVSARPWLSFGVLDAQEARDLQPLIDSYNRHAATGNYEAADEQWQAIEALLMKQSYLNQLRNFLQYESTATYDSYTKFLRRKDVEKALHTRSRKFLPFNSKVSNILRAEKGNAQPKIEALLEHYKVLAYCGNLDLLFPCSIAAENHRQWNWNGSQEFVLAPRETFLDNDSVAGYFKTGGRFTEAVFIGAGHMVSADKPAVTLDLITKWTHGKPLKDMSTWPYIFRLLKMQIEKNSSRNVDMEAPVTRNKTLNGTDQPISETRNQTEEITIVEASNAEAEIGNDTAYSKPPKLYKQNYNNNLRLPENESQNGTNYLAIVTAQTPTTEASTTETVINEYITVDGHDPNPTKVSINDCNNEIDAPDNETSKCLKHQINGTDETTTVKISNDIINHYADQTEVSTTDNWKKSIDGMRVPKNESLSEIESSKRLDINQGTEDTKSNYVDISAIEVPTTEADVDDAISGNNEEQTPVEGPLILTPYIKEGLLEQARNASEVNSTLFLGYKSYSGFLTVNETYHSNTFFWYFPVEGEPVEESPWLIWLQGGPGFTSLFGLASEIGPFSSDNRGGFMKNPWSWLRNHSLVFIDNPVGTGFSFTEHQDGYARDMETYSAHLYEATRQLLLLFPELQRAPLYVAGESYAGKYVPSLALELHNHKDETRVNLQGLLVGNGYIAPAMLLNFSRSFYEFGLLGPEDLAELRDSEMRFEEAVLANDTSNAKDLWISVLTDILRRTELRQSYNFLHSVDWTSDLMGCLEMVQDPAFNRAIHAGDVKNMLLNVTVTAQLKAEFLSSAKEKYEKLMEHYRVLLYCGQLDQMMSCGTASQFHETFNWSGRAAFLEAHKEPFKFNDTVAIYHKSGGNLTEAVVRGAGHTAPVDKGAPLQAFVTSWTHQPSLTSTLH